MALKLTLKIPIQVSFYNSLFFPAISDTLLLGVNPNKTDKALPGPGGAPRAPAHLSLLWSKFLLKNHVSPKAGINSNSFDPFSVCFGKVLKLKVTKGELIISNGLEMADNYLKEAVAATTPRPY